MARIALILERDYGLQADIRNYYADMPLNLARYDPRVVVHPFFYESDVEPGASYFAAWPDAIPVNMAWEQILYSIAKQIKLPRDAYATGSVRHVCWTDAYRRQLEATGVPASNTILAGSPVMHFYRGRSLRGYFKSRADLAVEYGLDPEGKWVLFPENYRWAFIKKGQRKIFLKNGASAEWIEQAQQYCRESMKVLFHALASLDQPDDPVFILRPRPATAASIFAEYIQANEPAALGNVKIIKGESARDWILASDHVISSYSTTIIEAALAGKPVNVFSPVPFPEALADDWYEKVDLLETGEALLGAIRAPARPETATPLADWAAARFLPSGDPCAQIAKAIHDAWRRTSTTPGTVADRNRLGWLRRSREEIRTRLQRGALYHRFARFRHPKYAFTLRKHEKDLFSAVEVARRVSRWAALSGTDASREAG